MINGDKDSSLIKNIKSPSATQTAVLDRQAGKKYLQNRGTKQYLGDRIREYKIFNPILKTSADGTVVCTVTKLTAGENAKNEIFGKNISKIRSVVRDIETAVQNSIFIENVQKCTKSILGTFSILKNSRLISMYSSTGGGDSRGLSVVHGEKVDSKLLDIYDNLQLKTSGRFVSSAVLTMLHTLCSICRLRYINGTAVLLVVTYLHAPARIILLIIMLYALVCRFYISCTSFPYRLSLLYHPLVEDVPFFLRWTSETGGAVIYLASTLMVLDLLWEFPTPTRWWYDHDRPVGPLTSLFP